MSAPDAVAGPPPDASARTVPPWRVVFAVIFVCTWCGNQFSPLLPGRWGLAYATGLTVVALGTAALVQPWAKRLDDASSARALVVALALTVVGLLAADAAQRARSPLLGAVDAVVMGAGIGVGLVSGLLAVQRIAGPRDLAGLTGVFYALAYAGFPLPTLMAAVTPPFSTTVLFLALAALALCSCGAVLRSYRAHLPFP